MGMTGISEMGASYGSAYPAGSYGSMMGGYGYGYGGGGGTSVGVIAAIVLGALVLLALIIVLLMRRTPRAAQPAPARPDGRPLEGLQRADDAPSFAPRTSRHRRSREIRRPAKDDQ